MNANNTWFYTNTIINTPQLHIANDATSSVSPGVAILFLVIVGIVGYFIADKIIK